VPPWTLPEKLAMSGVINTVIDSCAFPGSIAFSRFKAQFQGRTSAGALSAFSNQQLSGRRAVGCRHARIDLFPYIAPPLQRKSWC